jgi:ABC-type uncharacterized transport system substrate-binding protein
MRIKTIAVVTIGLLIAGAAFAVAHPHSVADARLGAAWHCSRTMVITTCQQS